MTYPSSIIIGFSKLMTDFRYCSDTQYIASFSGGLPDNIYLYVLQWQAIRRRCQTSDIVHCRVTVPDS